MYTDKSKAITAVVNNYFEGIFYGDVAKLKGSFINNAHIYGDIKGEAYSKTVDEYLEGVKTRKSPSELREEFKMELIGIEIMSDVAIVKVHLPMLGFNYYDFLSMTIVNGEWKIVNKVFTHVE